MDDEMGQDGRVTRSYIIGAAEECQAQLRLDRNGGLIIIFSGLQLSTSIIHSTYVRPTSDRRGRREARTDRVQERASKAWREPG